MSINDEIEHEWIELTLPHFDSMETVLMHLSSVSVIEIHMEHFNKRRNEQ